MTVFDPAEYQRQLVLARKEDKSASDSHRNVKCPKCDTIQSATHKKCSNCGHDLEKARRAKFAKLDASVDLDELGYQLVLAAGSLAKASTPEPWSTSTSSNWIAKVGGLPDYIQHLSHGIARSGKHTESEAIEMAVGICQHPPASWGADAKAACAKALAEWEAKKARWHAMQAAKATSQK